MAQILSEKVALREIENLKELFGSTESIFGPLTGRDERAVRKILESFDIQNCPEAYLARMARKCLLREVAFSARYFEGRICLVKEQRTLSFSVYCDVPGRGRWWLLEYVYKDGKWVLRKNPVPSETFACDESDIRTILSRALREELGINVLAEHLSAQHILLFEGALKLSIDALDGVEEDFHSVEWDPNFFVRNKIYRCAWAMPYRNLYFSKKGYQDKETTHRFVWHDHLARPVNL